MGRIATEGGFTFSWDFGVGYATSHAEGESASSSYDGIAFLGGLQTGYSF